MQNDYQLFFGDIHNHNALGYGLGSLERSIDIAQSHLDFFAFTGHASWHDMPEMEGGRERNWLRGFNILKAAWPKVQQLTADANENPDFAAFLGYEWHSSAYGDHCIIFPDDFRPLFLPDRVESLREFCIAENALMIPHHLAYPTGGRGVNWEVFNPVCTPVVEIYSEHGNSESDRGPFPFFNHSMGGRVTENTASAALMSGLTFGFVASSDNHRGFPGGFGEGLVAVWAKDLDRASILEAIRSRRTYAITGDRISIELTMDGNPMGSTVSCGSDPELAFIVSAPDELEVIEVIQGGKVVDRLYPEMPEPLLEHAESFQLRFEWGWGPWADLDLDRICDWAFEIEVEGGRIEEMIPCFQSGPYDENRRHRIQRISDSRYQIASYTARKGGYRGNPNQSAVLRLRANPDARLHLQIQQPQDISGSVRIEELWRGSQFISTGAFPAESALFHRIVPVDASTIRGKRILRIPPGKRDFVYLRVRQRNGQMAWTSPVFCSNVS